MIELLWNFKKYICSCCVPVFQNIVTYIYIYIYIATQSKCAKRREQSSVIKQLLETLFVAIKVCTDFTTDVI